MKIEKVSRTCMCQACRKNMEKKDWRVVYGIPQKYYHLTCLLDWAEKRKDSFNKLIKNIKKHRHLLAREKEKKIMRAI